MLSFVYARGTRLRRRRLVARSAVAAVVVVAAVLPIALVVYDGTGRTGEDTQVVDMPPTTIAPSPDTPPDADDTSGALGHATTSGAAAAPPADAPARPLLPETPPTPIDDDSPNTELAACGPAEADLATTTDKDSYMPGETVTVTARIRNTSNHPCLAPTGARFSVYRSSNPQSPRFQDQKPTKDNGDFVWAAGQTIELVFTWQTCGAINCQTNNGTFTAAVTWTGPGDFPTNTEAFNVGTPDTSVNVCCATNS